jgi:integrase
MPHFPKPFFKAKRGTWYVEIQRRQYALGSELNPDALARYAALMQEHHAEEPPPVPATAGAGTTVLAVLEKFLAWCQEHRSPDTYEWYRWRLQLFADSIDKALTAEKLRHFHVDDFLKTNPAWSSGTKHGMARAIMRAMRWAKRKGYVDLNPIADYEKPRPGKRKVVIAPADFEKMLALAGCQEFRDLLLVTWETACRPQESLIVEARHVDLENDRWVFPADEAKGEQWPRVIYLTDIALDITRRLMLRHPSGPLFRNSEGVPWTTDAVNCAFIRLQTRLGAEKLKMFGDATEPLPRFKKSAYPTKEELAQARREHAANLAARRKQRLQRARELGKKYCLYHLRHSWLDRALKRGVDALTCAILMGHRDPSTVSKVYQHLSQSPEYLRGAVKKAAG